MTEPELKRDGRVLRSTLYRNSTAECTECEDAWDGPTSIGAASGHTMTTGHKTTAVYEAAYEYAPNSDESQHKPYGRAKRRVAELLARGEDAPLRKDGASTNHRVEAE